MKRLNILFVSVAIVLILGLTSCEKNDPERTVGYSLGLLVRHADNQVTVETDLGNTLHLSNFDHTEYDNKRVYINFYINSESGKEIYVDWLYLDSILTKDIVPNTGLNEDSIGHTPIDIWEINSSGSYLNIVFAYKRYDFETRHFINMVKDDSQSTTDTLYLELRHNDYRTSQEYYYDIYTGAVSFNVEKLLPAGKTSIYLVIKNKPYNDAPIQVTEGLYESTVGVKRMMSRRKSVGTH